MALRGTLETFPLADVLRLLTFTNQSGRLKLEAPVGTGSVWVGEGSIVAATSSRVGEAPATESLADLLRWSAGAFAFTAQEPTPPSSQVHDCEQLLGEAQLLVEEWDDLQALVPSLEHRVALVRALASDAVALDGAQWSWLVAVGGGCTVRQLAAALDVTELGVLRVVRALLGLGVATVSPPPRSGRPRYAAARYGPPSGAGRSGLAKSG